MTHLSITVYKYNPETKETRQVSSWSKKVEELPNQPLMDGRWPMCECWKCKGKDTPNRR